MTTPISPDQQVAQALLLLQNKDPIVALNLSDATSAAIAEVLENNPDPSDEEINDATLTALQSLGYVVNDLTSLNQQADYLKNNHAGFWSGRYTLVDSQGSVHALLIDSERVQLLLNGIEKVMETPSEGGGFKEGKLIVNNAQVDVNFSFSTTIDHVNFEETDTYDTTELADSFQFILNGTLVVKADQIGFRNVKGKRGVSTPAGVFHYRGEEPVWVWAGEYRLRDTADEWEIHSDTLVVAYDTVAQKLSLKFGSLEATAVAYRNSIVCYRLELTKGVLTQVTMEMRTTSGGMRKCYIWFETTGQIRTLNGYAINPLDSSSLWNDPRLIGFRPAVPKPASRVMGEGYAAASLRAMAVGDARPDFCATANDVCFSAKDLVGRTTDKPNATVIGAKNLIGTDPGFVIEERDANGISTGRRAIFVYSGPPSDHVLFSSSITSVRAFQGLGADNRPLDGLENSQLGVYVNRPMKITVTESNYNVRFNLTDFNDIDPSGLTIALVFNDTPEVAASLTPSENVSCEYSVRPRKGPAPTITEKVTDFTKASALLQGTFANGIPQSMNYIFALTPKNAANQIKVIRQIQSKDNTGNWIDTGAAVTLTVPILSPVTVRRRATASIHPLAATRRTSLVDSPTIVDFCRTTYDSTFSANDLIALQDAPDKNTPTRLFGIDTIQVGSTTVTGFRVNGVDSESGRIAMFRYATPNVETHFYPKGSKLKAYQTLDEAGLPQAGLQNASIGVLIEHPFELPGLVETDFYETRMSLLDYGVLNSDGLDITLAIDDARQPGLLALFQPPAATCTIHPDGTYGPDTEITTLVPDYTKASVLVRGATGETQVVGMKNYYFSVCPKSGSGFFEITKTIYKSSNSNNDSFIEDGTPTTMRVPILMRMPILMDSRDALELSGTNWMPAVRGKPYAAEVTAMKGQQDFIWRIFNGDRPKGLEWYKGNNGMDAVTSIDTDKNTTLDISEQGLVSFKLKGDVDSSVDPGTMYQPSLRIMSAKTCVMKPIYFNPQIMIAEPDVEGKAGIEKSNAASAWFAGLGAVATMILTIILWKKDAKREAKQLANAKNIELIDRTQGRGHEINTTVTQLQELGDKLSENGEYMERLEKRLKFAEKSNAVLRRKMKELQNTLNEEREEMSSEEKDLVNEEISAIGEEISQSESKEHDQWNEKDKVEHKKKSKNEK
jgi:hypothetical protein